MYIAGKSDIGLVRSTNQDNYLIVKNKDNDVLALCQDQKMCQFVIKGSPFKYRSLSSVVQKS